MAIPASAHTDPAEQRAVDRLLERGALFAVSHSGGKDSQAMTLELARLVPPEQMIVIHAPLGEVEWSGTLAHIEATIPAGVPLLLAPTASGKTLLERIEERGKFPDPKRRFCTSDFKTGPIEREIRRYLKRHPRFGGQIVSTLGIRAEESPSRAQQAPWSHHERASRAGRQWFTWLPIFRLTTTEVFKRIRDAGQTPHWIYSYVSRCSCSFCIFGSRADLRTAAELRPELYAKYAALEQRLGHTLSPSRTPLPQLTGIPAPTRLRRDHTKR